MAGFATGGIFSDTNTSTQVSTGEAAQAKANLKSASPTYAAACATTEKKQAAVEKKKGEQEAIRNSDSYKDAKAKSDASTAAYNKNQTDQKTKEAEISATEAKVSSAKKKEAAALETYNDEQERIADLKKDGSPEALAEVEQIEKNSTAADNLSAAQAEAAQAELDLSKQETELQALKDAEDGLEDTMEKDKDAFDAEEEKATALDSDIEAAESELDAAIRNENEVLDEQAEKYPETIGKDAKTFQSAIEVDRKNAAKKKSDEAKAAKAKTDAEAAKKEKELADAQRPKDLEKVKNTPPDKDGMLLSFYYDEAAAAKCATRACLDKVMKDAKVKMEIARIKQLQNELEFATDPKRAAEIAARLKAAKAVPGVEEALNPGVAAALLGGAGIASKSGELIWDSPKAAVDMGGRLDDLIKDHMQPKYKHAYLGEFPGKLEALDWMVKSMDRPKIDVEYVEQVRNNVKRQYPVKYSFGDISFTFWDNVEHKTIKTLHEYFTGKVWQHFSVSGSGFMLLRDSTIIPKLIVWDLSVSGEDNLKYCFENCSLSSFDFDANEDETDEGVHTIQAVFKFERYNVLATKATPRVLGMKSVTWM